MDLLVALLVVLALSTASAYGGWRFGRRATRRSGRIATAAIASVLLAYVFTVHDTLYVAMLLPVSSAVILGNIIPVGCGFLVGYALTRSDIPRRRRALISAATAAVAFFALVRPLLTYPHPSRNRWTTDDVCLQSNYASCSACAGATLLAHHGIPASESEMQQLCLTTRRGTPRLGLYRGLSIKTAETPYSTGVFVGDLPELVSADVWPVILLVMLEERGDVDPRYERDWGWTPGLGHAVLMYGPPSDGRVEIADSSVGREHWTVTALDELWHGNALYLRPRD